MISSSGKIDLYNAHSLNPINSLLDPSVKFSMNNDNFHLSNNSDDTLNLFTRVFTLFISECLNAFLIALDKQRISSSCHNHNCC